MPPLSEQARRSRRWWNAILWGGVLSVLGVVWLSLLILRNDKFADRSHGCNNARQIGLALLDFEDEYGSLPNADTLAKVRAKYPASTVPLGTSSSNDFFRQLIVAEISQSEAMFFARTVGTRDHPDDVTVGSEALKKGECSFAYILGASYSADPPVPVAITPLERGRKTADLKTLRKYRNYGDKVAVLMSDNSARIFSVDMKTGRILHGGKDLFDPSQPFWHGKVPDVVWPE